MSSSKAELRERMTRMREALSPASVADLSARAVRRLCGLPEVRRARSVFTYVSHGCEVDTLPLIRSLLAAGKVVSVPLVVSKGVMEAHRILSLDDLVPGRFGILSPARPSPLPDTPDVTVCPGLAFTVLGDRLGRGQAYYDRFLDQHYRTFPCGLAYDFQIVEALPSDDLDRRVAAVVTESRTVRAGGTAATP